MDSCLSEKAELINSKINLADWHNILNPTAEAWWWDLEPPTHPWDKFDWLWGVLAVLFVTIALGLLTNTSSRFLSGGPDTPGAIAVAVQSVLTLLGAGGALTKAGREGIEGILPKLNIPKHFQEEARCALALLLLVLFCGINSSLPWIADCYNGHGVRDYGVGLLSSAQKKFNRAVLLNPNGMQAHYNLGRVYEDLQDLSHARTEYQIAVQGSYSSAYNDLARLFIIEDKNYSAAISLLLKGLKLIYGDGKDHAELRYALLKNLGWAWLRKQNYEDSELRLKEAIKLASKKAPAHCLLAQVLEGQDNKKEALLEWEKCLRYASHTDPCEDTWIALARQRLRA